MTETPVAHDPFRILVGWPAIAAEPAEAIRAFWSREGALTDPGEVDQRLRQVIVYATGADGDIAGVATALPCVPPRFGQPVYYLRTFVGRAARGRLLMRELTVRACAVLEDYERQRGFAYIGVLVELENARFGEALRRPVWGHPPFHYVGLSLRGLEMRALFFKGAMLKAPGEMNPLQSPQR